MVNLESTREAAQLPPDVASAEVAEQLADAISSNAASVFDEMLPRVVHRMLGDGPAADEALASGGFVLDDCTVVLRLNPEVQLVEFFCDVGLPRAHAEHAVYRTAMEMNLCRSHPGIVFGVHPESGRLVATTAIPALSVSDDEVCVAVLRSLTQVVANLRAARTFDVEL